MAHGVELIVLKLIGPVNDKPSGTAGTGWRAWTLSIAVEVNAVLTCLDLIWGQNDLINLERAMRTVLSVCLLALGLMLSSCSNSKTKAELIGYWESTDAKKSASIEFTKEGYAILGGNSVELFDSKVMKMIREFKMNLPEKTMKYKVTDKEHIQVEGNFGQLMEKLSDGGTMPANGKDGYDFFPVESLSFKLAESELTLTSPSGKEIKFRKSE